MKPTGKPNLNTRTYWNYIYTTPAKETEYWTMTSRFSTILNYLKDGDKFLDMGCGVGIPCRMIQEKKKNCETWGVDISDEVIKNNQKDAPLSTWKQGFVGNLSFLPDNYFDVIFCGEVIEHLDFPDEAFSDAYRLLKKGGKFIITTPQDNHIESPEHVWEYSKEDVEKLYKDAGFTDVKFVELDDMEYMIVFFGVGVK